MWTAYYIGLQHSLYVCVPISDIFMTCVCKYFIMVYTIADSVRLHFNSYKISHQIWQLITKCVFDNDVFISIVPNLNMPGNSLIIIKMSESDP